MPLSSFPQFALDSTRPELLLLGASLCLLSGAGIGFWIAHRRDRWGAQIGPPDVFGLVSRAQDEIRAAGPDPLEIAETAYLQVVRLLPTASFQIGVYNGDCYRTLLRIHTGDRAPNMTVRVEPEDQDLLHILRRTPQPARLLKQNPEILQDAGPLFGAEITTPGSIMLRPLRADGHTFGLMGASHPDHGAYNETQELIFEMLVDQVAHSLERHSLQEEAYNRGKIVNLINQVSRRLISLEPLGESFSYIADLLMKALGRDQVRLFEAVGDELLLGASVPRFGDLPEMRIPLGSGPIGQVGAEGRILRYTSIPGDGEEAGGRSVSGLAVPLRVEGRILGVLDIQSRTKRPFSDEEIKMAEMIAAQLAIATLETRNFTRQQEETYIRTVLLEVARHAARPGDPAQALHSVLQLTTLIAGTRWAVLLLSEEEGRRLRVGPTAGIRRAGQDSIQGFAFDLSEFGMQTNAQASETSRQIHLPGRLATILGSEQASRFVLSDGETTLGLLLTEASSADAEHSSLLAGIAHQVSLRLQNVRLMQEASRRQALENEIAMARDIQSSFLPRIVPHHQGWQIGISWASAREVGGDFYDFIRLDPGQSGSRWGIAVGDVSGKSVPAALFMAVTRTLLRSIAPSHVDPGLALRRVNSMLQLESLSDYFVSIFYAVWEPETGSILCANGGHNPPLLIAPDGTSQWLSEHGMVLGVKENVSYATRRCQFSDGSLLILYTDGVTEASAPDEEFFGTERLRSLCESLHEQDAQTIVDSVSRAVHEFSAVDALSDDLTVLALKRVARDSEPQVELNPPGGER